MDNKQLLIHAGVFAVGAGLGYGAGYLVYKKKFQKISDEDIESVREAYSKNAKVKPDLKDFGKTIDVKAVVKESVVESSDTIISTYGYLSASDTDAADFKAVHGRTPTTYELIQMGNGTPVEDAVRNSFDHDDSNVVESNLLTDNLFENPPEQDPELLGNEENVRNPDRPYVIPVANWMTNDTDYDQITLTFWADDDVLANDDGSIINDVEGYVGITNLHRFGFLSEDPETVYVRNERIGVDYEITKDERNYSEVVRNIRQDDNSNSPRRMRSNDE